MEQGETMTSVELPIAGTEGVEDAAKFVTVLGLTVQKAQHGDAGAAAAAMMCAAIITMHGAGYPKERLLEVVENRWAALAGENPKPIDLPGMVLSYARTMAAAMLEDAGLLPDWGDIGLLLMGMGAGLLAVGSSKPAVQQLAAVSEATSIFDRYDHPMRELMRSYVAESERTEKTEEVSHAET